MKSLTMYCDNRTTIEIANNPIFHERTKHIKADNHFIKEIVMSKKVVTPYIKSKDQLGDVFTKALGRNIFFVMYSKLGLSDIYASV